MPTPTPTPIVQDLYATQGGRFTVPFQATTVDPLGNQSAFPFAAGTAARLILSDGEIASLRLSGAPTPAGSSMVADLTNGAFWVDIFPADLGVLTLYNGEYQILVDPNGTPDGTSYTWVTGGFYLTHEAT